MTEIQIGQSLTFVLVFGIILVMGVFLGHAEDENSKLKEEAVKRGFAYWDVKPDGSTEFKWREKAE
jgi:hypothetical protein